MTRAKKTTPGRPDVVTGALASAPPDTADTEEYPGRRLGLIGLLLACTVNVVGLTVSTIALVRSARAGRRNPAAAGGIVIGALSTIVLVAVFYYVLGVLDGDVGVCADLGPGTHQEGMMTYTCAGDDAPQ